jgi:hypothetical protein
MQGKLLPVRERFREGESIYGYVRRAADASGYAEIPDFMERIQITPIVGDRSFQKVDRVLKSEVSKIAYFCDQVNQKLDSSAQLVAHKDVDYGHSRFCPACLKADGYWRAIWETDLIRTCPVHLSELMESCPKCASTDLWKRKGNTVCVCGFDLAHASISMVSGAAVAIAVQAQSVVAKGEILSFDSTDILATCVTFQEYCWLLRELLEIQILHPICYCSTTGNAPRLTDFEYTAGAKSLVTIFENVPSLVSHLSKQLQDVPVQQRALVSGLRNAPWHFLAERQGFLRKFDFIKDALNAAAQTQDLVNRPATKHERAAVSDENGRWFRFCEDTGVSFECVEMVANAHPDDFVQTYDGSDESLEAVRYSAKCDSLVATVLEHLIPASLMARSLSISRRHMERFLEGTLVKVYHLPAKGDETLDSPRSAGAFVDRRELEQILFSLVKLADERGSGADFILLTEVFQGDSARQRYTMATLIEDVLNGKVRVQIRPKITGFKAFEFNESDIKKAVKDRRLGHESENQMAFDESLLSCAAADKRFQLTSGITQQAIRLGLIQAKKLNARRWVVPIDELEKFMKGYITPREVATLAGVGQTSVSAKLIHLGIRPCAGPGIRGGGTYLFHRRDVTEQVIGKLRTLERYNTRAGRPKNGRRKRDLRPGDLLDSLDATLILDVSLQYFVHNLVRYGEITETLWTDAMGRSKRGYSRTDIIALGAKLRAERKKYISLSDAANEVGESPTYFVRRWVKTGLLETENLRGDTVVERRQLLRLPELSSRYLTAAELASKCGVRLSYIRFLVRIHALKPIQASAETGEDDVKSGLQLFDLEEAVEIVEEKAAKGA